jgi:hypothetical protein
METDNVPPVAEEAEAVGTFEKATPVGLSSTCKLMPPPPAVLTFALRTTAFDPVNPPTGIAVAPSGLNWASPEIVGKSVLIVSVTVRTVLPCPSVKFVKVTVPECVPAGRLWANVFIPTPTVKVPSTASGPVGNGRTFSQLTFAETVQFIGRVPVFATMYWVLPGEKGPPKFPVDASPVPGTTFK